MSEKTDKPTALPDLPDMMAAGMGLTAALAFWSKMMNSGQRGRIDWWAEMRRAAGAGLQ